MSVGSACAGLLQFVVVAWVFGIREYATLMKYRIQLDLGLYFTTVWRFVGPFLMSGSCKHTCVSYDAEAIRACVGIESVVTMFTRMSSVFTN